MQTHASRECTEEEENPVFPALLNPFRAKLSVPNNSAEGKHERIKSEVTESISQSYYSEQSWSDSS